MQFEAILNKAKRYTWWSEEAPAVPMFCIWARAFVEQSKYWHPRLPTIIICFFKNDFIFEETPEQEKLEIWDYTFQQHLRRPNYQKQLYQKWLKIVRRIKKEGEVFFKHHKKMTDRQLAISFKKFSSYIFDHWRITWVQESGDVFSTYELPKLMKRELSRFSPKQIIDLALALSAPLQLSFVEKERVDILETAIKWQAKIKQSKKLAEMPKPFSGDLDRLLSKYIWSLSNYKEGRSLTLNYLWKEIRSECLSRARPALLKERQALLNRVKKVKKEKRSLLERVKLSGELQTAFKILEFWSGWIDERKRIAVFADWYLEEYAKEIAKRLKINIWLVKYLTSEEIETALLKRQMPSLKTLRARRSLSAFVEIKDAQGRRQEHIFVGAKARMLWRTLFKPKANQKIAGQVASAAMNSLTGKVQVVFDANRDRFDPGNILVTTMTRPEFMPLMRRAKAVITDEGGITCHAAIVSRELGIPCVIGTKIATKVLKSGDLVEIDTDKGLVRVIKSKV